MSAGCVVPDTPHKVNGSGKYGTRRAPSLHADRGQGAAAGCRAARRSRGRQQGAKDQGRATQIPHGVAVLADGSWAAEKGHDALEIEWDDGANAGLSRCSKQP
jgi:isoquinoline 1-oxidoreductase beta subunit